MNFKVLKIQKKKKIFSITFLFLGFLFFCYGFLSVDFSFNDDGWNFFFQRLKRIFSFDNYNENFPDISVWQISLRGLFLTLQFVSFGNFFGFVFAFLTSYLIIKGKNKIFFNFKRIVIIVLRSFPLIFITILWKFSFPKTLTASLIIFWFTWIWNHKYLFDLFQNANYGIIQKNNKKFVNFYKDIYLKNKIKIFTFYVNSFQSNLKWSGLLSTFGIIGLSNLITDFSEGYYFNNIGIPFFVLFVSIVIIDLVIFVFNKLLFLENQKVNYKNIIFCFFVFINFFLSSFFLFQIDWKILETRKIFLFLKLFFQFDFSLYHQDENINFINIFFSFFYVVKIAWFILCLSGFIAFFYSFLVSEIFIKNKKTILIFRLIYSFFKSFTLFFLIVIFSPLFSSRNGLITFILIINSWASLVKFFSSSINSIKTKNLHNKFLILSKKEIIFQNVLPKIKKDIIVFLIFKFEEIIRYLLFLRIGIFSSKGVFISLGSLIVDLENFPSKLFSVILFSMSFYIFLESLTFMVITEKIKFSFI